MVALPARHVPHRATRFDTRDASRTRASLSTRWTSSETSFSMVATVLRAPSRPAMLETVPSRPPTCPTAATMSPYTLGDGTLAGPAARRGGSPEGWSPAAYADLD